MTRHLAALSGAALLLSFLAPPARAADVVVTRFDDPEPDGCVEEDCSLREAMILSNSQPGSTIALPAGVYRLTRVPAPTDPENGLAGSLYANRPVTITGAGRDVTFIDARPADEEPGVDRVLLVGSLGAATIQGVTLRGGRVAPGSPRNATGGIGGCLWVQQGVGSGPTTLVDAAVTDCEATNSGGGVLVQKGVVDDGQDDLVLIRTEVLRNRTTSSLLGQGGGIWISHANARIVDSTIDGNISPTTGGGVMLSETQSQLRTNLVVTGSTISNNVAGEDPEGNPPLIGGVGGGIYNAGGSMDIENTTIAFNAARPGSLPIPSGQGGGVQNTPKLSSPRTTALTNCTVAYNEAELGQLYSTVLGDSSGLLIANTLVAQAPGGGPDCAPVGHPGGAGVVSLGGNISSDGSVCNLKPMELGDQAGVADPGLAEALADNGGETDTLAIEEGSPAIGRGQALHCPAEDQRGSPRKPLCDVGAYETVDALAIPKGLLQAAVDNPEGDVGAVVPVLREAAGL